MKVITIGRHPENDIVIDDNIISLNHLRIKLHDDGHFTLEDLHSTNSTYINGKRIEGEVRLHENDIVRIGKTILPWQSYFSSSNYISSKKPKSSRLLPFLCGATVGAALILVMIFCGLLDYGNHSVEQSADEEPWVCENTTDCETHDYIIVSSEYSPTSIYVPQGKSLQNAFYDKAPKMEYGWQKPYVGGAKLIAEISADAAGINLSCFEQDCFINILPLHMLKFRIFDDPSSLYVLAFENMVSIENCEIRDNGVFSDDFGIWIQIINKTGQDVEVNIPQGQMIEAENDNVQNVVVTEDKKIELQPYESKIFCLSASCASQHRSSPSGSKGRITPYVMTAPKSTYHSQKSIWDYIEEPATQRLVFYAWGPGPLEDGHKSRKGHAFVYVPEIGYIGYGSAHGDWINDEGVISDHLRQVQYAQDSCVVWVTNSQLNNIHTKVNQLLSHTPRYHLGNNDCTSFVMDIADAAGIYYGRRMPWRTPMGFIEELKKRN